MKKLHCTLLFFSLLLSGLNAQVTFNPSQGCGPLTVHFNSINIPGAYTYKWTMDGGQAVLTGQSLNYTFTTPGWHYFDFETFDAGGAPLIYDHGNINVWGFDTINSPVSTTGACLNDRVGFNISGNYPPGNVSVDWDFGDSSPSVSGNHTWADHAYTALGNYIVKADVTTQCGTEQVTSPVHVIVNAPVGNVYLQSQPDSACPGDNIDFYTPSGYDNFIIEFGDGAVEHNSRRHSYYLPGTYIIKATFFNGCGNSAIVTDTVHITTNIAVPNHVTPNYISINDSVTCPATAVSFYAPGGFSSYSWDLGNGSTSNVDNPTATYPSVGTYTVSLTLKNGCGYSKTLNRRVYVQGSLPVPAFSFMAPDSICPGTSLLINMPSGVPKYIPVFFNFGDGQTATAQNQEQLTHLYAAPGTYTITATITNGCGNSNSYSLPVVVNSASTLNTGSFMAGSPVGVGCPGDSVFFIVSPPDIGSFLLNFGDGQSATQPISILNGPDGTQYAIFKHPYTALGNYNPTIQVTTPCGSSVTQSMGSVNISTNNAIDGDAGFFFNESKYYCLNEQIGFMAYGASTYEWDFGDGSGKLITTSSLVAVYHGFSQPGTYDVKLVMHNSCGASDTNVKSVIIPDSRINISTSSVSPSCGQSNGKAIAIVNGANSPFKYNWTNGDKSFIADTLSSGIYYVSVADAKGCKNFAVATVSDAQAPTISLNNIIDASCYGQATGAIDITLIGSSAPYSYVWSNGKTVEDINQLAAGPYEIIVKDANGCKATKSISIHQPPDFNISYVSYPSACGGSTGVVQTSVQGTTGPYNYLWSNGYNTPSVSGISAGIYTVTVVDSKGCLKDKIVTLNETGAPIVILDSVAVLSCDAGGGANVYVSTYLGTSPYTYHWSNNILTEDLVNVQPGFYSLQVKGNNNCKAMLTVNINEQIPAPLSICAITVDTTTQTNRVIWEKGSRTDISSFNVYRESSQSGLYYYVGNVDVDSLHQYIDPVADPSIRGWRYRVTAVSACGEESFQSDLHKTIHLTINKGLGNAYNLIWDNYEGLLFNKFYVWRYTTATHWVKIDSLPANLNSYTDLTAPSIISSPDLMYMTEGGPVSSCDPTRGAINTSRSNIKTARFMNTNGIAAYNTMSENMYVFPNPSNGNITIKLDRPLDRKTELSIVNTLGETVVSAQFDQSSLSKNIDLSAYANGVYFIKLTMNDKVLVKRLVLNK